MFGSLSRLVCRSTFECPGNGFWQRGAVFGIKRDSPLNAGQDGGNIIRGTPPVLEDVQTKLSGSVDVWMEHLADELDARRFVGILLFEMHHKSKGAILERRVSWADDHSVPSSDDLISMLFRSP